MLASRYAQILFGRDLRNHGIAKRPTGKKKLKRKSITVATMPPVELPVETVPARIAIHAH